MAKQLYTRIFGIEGDELQSWSCAAGKYVDAKGYSKHLCASRHVPIKFIAWEENELSLLSDEVHRLEACVKAIQECRTFEGWSAAVPDCPELQDALRRVGINIDLDPSSERVGPRKPKPTVCPEIWHTKPFDPAEAWAATMQACKGGGTR